MQASTLAVIVHFGELAPTVATAHSLVDFNAELVVVANDRSQRPTDLDARVQWIIPERNLGYAGALMLAAADRREPVVVVLNNDIVLPRLAFEQCVSVLRENPGIGVVGPALRQADGTLQSGAAHLSRWLRVPMSKVDPGTVIADCDWVCGAIFFVRREVLDQFGMESFYFLGYEETDLCLRARRAGWRVVCCGYASACHRGGAVIGMRWHYYLVRNRIWLLRENFGPFAAALCTVRSVLLLGRVVFADILKRRDLTTSRLYRMGLVHGWSCKPKRAAGPLAGEPLTDRLLNAGRHS